VPAASDPRAAEHSKFKRVGGARTLARYTVARQWADAGFGSILH